MEKLKQLKRTTAALALAGGSMLVASCAEEEPTVVRDETVRTELTNATYVVPGEGTAVRSISAGPLYEELKNALPIVDHQYPHGREDNRAPVITDAAMRVDAHVALSGKGSDRLDNDAACDSFRIQDYQSIRSIGALSLGDAEDAPLIVWPEIDGRRSEYAYLCFFEGNEPSEGVVLFTEGGS